MEKKVADFPIEDTFGDEIKEGDVYFQMSNIIILEQNLSRFFNERMNVPSFRAI